MEIKEILYVCDVKKIPEQDCDQHLIYLRKILNIDQETIKLTPRLKLKELGDFDSLRLTVTDLPYVGDFFENYTELPKSWENVENPAERTVSQTNLGDLIKESWWKKIPGYEKE